MPGVESSSRAVLEALTGVGVGQRTTTIARTMSALTVESSSAVGWAGTQRKLGMVALIKSLTF